jgi:hypothetical protein
MRKRVGGDGMGWDGMGWDGMGWAHRVADVVAMHGLHGRVCLHLARAAARNHDGKLLGEGHKGLCVQALPFGAESAEGVQGGLHSARESQGGTQGAQAARTGTSSAERTV